jgi:hypothetical protein
MFNDIDSNMSNLSSEKMTLLFVLKQNKQRRGETVTRSWEIAPYDIMQNGGGGVLSFSDKRHERDTYVIKKLIPFNRLALEMDI